MMNVWKYLNDWVLRYFFAERIALLLLKLGDDIFEGP